MSLNSYWVSYFCYFLYICHWLTLCFYIDNLFTFSEGHSSLEEWRNLLYCNWHWEAYAVSDAYNMFSFEAERDCIACNVLGTSFSLINHIAHFFILQAKWWQSDGKVKREGFWWSPSSITLFWQQNRINLQIEVWKFWLVTILSRTCRLSDTRWFYLVYKDDPLGFRWPPPAVINAIDDEGVAASRMNHLFLRNLFFLNIYKQWSHSDCWKNKSN